MEKWARAGPTTSKEDGVVGKLRKFHANAWRKVFTCSRIKREGATLRASWDRHKRVPRELAVDQVLGALRYAVAAMASSSRHSQAPQSQHVIFITIDHIFVKLTVSVFYLNMSLKVHTKSLWINIRILISVNQQYYSSHSDFLKRVSS